VDTIKGTAMNTPNPTRPPEDAQDILLADIGGTHVRLALSSREFEQTHQSAFHAVEKYKALDWPDFEGLVRAYLDNHSKTPQSLRAMAIASAVRPEGKDGRIIRFDPSYKNNNWVIDRDALSASFGGVPCTLALDTQAQFHTIRQFHKNTAPHDLYECLHQGGSLSGHCGQNDTALMVSVGTGLGHAYGACQSPQSGGDGDVRPTFGGHMVPACATTEQQDAMHSIAQSLHGKRHVIFEDIVSGRGFFGLYSFACHRKAMEPAYNDVFTLMADGLDPDNQEVQSAARLFCEFLGLYVNVVATSIHAFGGVYLIGSILRRLREVGLFDEETVKKSMWLDMVQVVDRAWREAPIYLGRAQHLTLHGLCDMARQHGDGAAVSEASGALEARG